MKDEVEYNVEREAVLNGDMIIINSGVVETLGKAKFKEMYNNKSLELANLQQQIGVFKEQLKGLNAEFDEEIIEFKRKFDLMQALTNKENIQSKLREMEKRLSILDKELKSFSSLYLKLR